jgi:hypothetical protein
MAQYQAHPADGTPLDAAAYLPDAVEPGARGSGVSWGAIFAGAAGAASLSLVLLLLGTGLGMSSVSPWSNQGASATTIGIATILWLSFTQLAASGLGGYLAGRLRTRWIGVHTDEVYFRDTAHGFLAWSVATLLTAGLLSSAVGTIVGAGAQAGATVAGGAVAATAAAGTGAAASQAGSQESGPGATGYFVDALFRRDAGAPPAVAPAPAPAADAAATPGMPTTPTAPAVTATPAPERSPAAVNAEVTRIFVQSLRTGALPPEDRSYVGQLVAQRTGMSQPEAEKRVTDTYAKAQAALKETQAKAQEAADAARKASAWAALWLVVSLLVGAFVASFAATHGGRRRDL